MPGARARSTAVLLTVTAALLAMGAVATQRSTPWWEERAVDRIAVEILRRMEKRPTLVVWALDASGSLLAERKRLVRSTRVGRAHEYAPAQSRDEIVGQATREFLINAFGGRVGDAVLAILSAGGLSPEEKTEIKRELQRNKTMAAKKTAKKAAKKAPAKKAPAKKA